MTKGTFTIFFRRRPDFNPTPRADYPFAGTGRAYAAIARIRSRALVELRPGHLDLRVRVVRRHPRTPHAKFARTIFMIFFSINSMAEGAFVKYVNPMRKTKGYGRNDAREEAGDVSTT